MPIARLVQFVRDSLSSESEAPEAERHEAIRLATAAVLLDIANADSEMSKAEEANVIEHLRSAFDLGDDVARDLIDAAEEIRSQTIDHWYLTDLIRKNSSFEERLDIVRRMWRIVYADGYFHQYEGYLVRKLSDLMGLQHHVMIDVKMEVRKELGLE